MLAAMCSGKCEVISRETTIQPAVNVLQWQACRPETSVCQWVSDPSTPTFPADLTGGMMMVLRSTHYEPVQVA